jgi:hypothetical protein
MYLYQRGVNKVNDSFIIEKGKELLLTAYIAGASMGASMAI